MAGLDKWTDAKLGKEDVHTRADRLSREANNGSLWETPQKSRDAHLAAAEALRSAAKDAPELKRMYGDKAADHEKKAASFQKSIDARKASDASNAPNPWAEKPKAEKAKKPGKRALKEASEASARAEKASSYAPTTYGSVGHMRSYISTPSGTRETSQFVAQHHAAANAHLEAAAKQRAVGNEEKAKQHLEKANYHADKTGLGASGWDESKHPRDNAGKFT